MVQVLIYTSDIERRISKQQINEVPVLDCKSCISSGKQSMFRLEK